MRRLPILVLLASGLSDFGKDHENDAIAVSQAAIAQLD